MLVLGRKVGETIVIDGQISVTVLEIKGGRIKLGIQAPSSVSIHRSELQATLAKNTQPCEFADSILVCT